MRQPGQAAVKEVQTAGTVLAISCHGKMIEILMESILPLPPLACPLFLSDQLQAKTISKQIGN